MRRLPLLAFGALVMATIAAFFVTQHLKVSTPLIAGSPRPLPATISPNQLGCGGFFRYARFSFYLLHRADDVAVYVVDQNGAIVRTLSSGRRMRRGVRDPDGEFPWDGRNDSGAVAPDGTYHFRIALLGQGRTIDLAKTPVVVKTAPPQLRVTSVSPSLIPQRGAQVQIHYTGNENRGGTIRLYRTDLPPGPRLVKSFVTPWHGSVASWDGKINRLPAPAGTYLVGLDVTDNACNTGHFPSAIPPPPGSTPHAGVTVRYLAAQPPMTPVPAGSRALVYVDSRQRPYSWTLQRVGAKKVAAKGSGRSFALNVQTPSAAGASLYVLSIRSGPDRTAVPLVVRAAHTHAKVLVVLPALTWQGQNPVDDDGDGVPNTLTGDEPIDLARPLASGLPAGFADEAALLAYLDKSHSAYDLTTDLGLLQGVGPSLGRHAGVVLAGSERWLPTSAGDELRSYVQNGGHVLSLGVDSLRRAVTVSAGKALDPTAPAANDVFGAQPGALVHNNRDLITVIRDGLGMFTNTSGAFPGFSTYQPVTTVAPPAQAPASAAGTAAQTASIVGFKLGRGVVIEVGLGGFGSSLTGNVDAQELINQVWTLLSG